MFGHSNGDFKSKNKKLEPIVQGPIVPRDQPFRGHFVPGHTVVHFIQRGFVKIIVDLVFL
jgi:hypothetical protein